MKWLTVRALTLCIACKTHRENCKTKVVVIVDPDSVLAVKEKTSRRCLQKCLLEKEPWEAQWFFLLALGTAQRLGTEREADQDPLQRRKP